MLILILNLELPFLNSCSKIATKVRDLRPKMSSKVGDSGQNVCTHRLQRYKLFPALLKLGWTEFQFQPIVLASFERNVASISLSYKLSVFSSH